MKALDAFRAVLNELDKHASPTFEPEQFNHQFNATFNEYIAENYGRYDVFQKDVDDVRSLVKTSGELTLTSGSVALPVDYRHMIKVKVYGTFTVKVGRNALDSQKWFKKVERRLSMEHGYREDNAYLKASHISPYYELEGDNLVVDIGPKVTATKAIIQYIKVLPTIYLSPNPSDDFEVEANNTTIPVPLHVYYELVTKCANRFLENIESQRVQLRLQQDQLRA